MSFRTLHLFGALHLCALANLVMSQTITFHITEEARTRTEVGNIVDAANLRDVYSPEVLPQLRFRFRKPDPLFEIIESSGVIRTRRVIDREELPDCMYTTECLIEQEVMITPFQYIKIVPISIRIDDTNDHGPTFPQPRVSLNIPENVAVNTSYRLAGAEDPDSGVFGIQRYELVTQTGVFGIHVNILPDGTKHLAIVVLKGLDRENENFYSIQIRAVDGGDPAKSGTVVVDIIIDDANDNSPVFDNTQYEVHIYENLDIGTEVVQVTARDVDVGDNGVICYEFDTQTQTNFGSYFGINNKTGLLYVKGEIDFETHQAFLLTVVARDLGRSTERDFAKINIVVIDVNDNPPVISVNTLTDNQYARVPENMPAGHTVAYVGVSDPDTGPGGNITCGIDNGYFRIHGRPNAGSIGFEVVSAQPFDREKQAEYTLLVHCEDQGDPQQSSSVRIPIQVTDVNDNSPKFIPDTNLFSVWVAENNHIDDMIIKVNATDKDTMENAAIRYNMSPVEDTPDGAVGIDLITGVIRAKIEFDYEKRNIYKYKIMATDQGVPPRLVTTFLNLMIEDTNDGYPHFVKASYSFNVLENQVANTKVGEIEAVDTDAEPFNDIIYSLQPGKDSYKFHIDGDNGIIVTSTIIDREEMPIYHLVGVASNRGYPDIRTTVNITVHIDDENDNPPVIVFPTDTNNTIQVPTRMDIGYHVTQIEASDPDGSEYGDLEFDISSGNEGGIFTIDHDTGAISAAVATEMSNLKTQMLVLKVKDNGIPQKTTFARLNIVFNSSVALTKGLLGSETLTLLIVAAVGGCVFIVVVIAVAIFCLRRSRRRREKKENVYNCRAEEAKKALANDSHSSGESVPEKSIDTGINNKTKEKSKKEVTFSVDMDDGWPMQNEKAVIENPHAQHIDPSDCRPPHTERERSPELTEEPQDCPSRIVRPVSRQSSCCMCRAPPLTQHNLDILEYNNLLWHNSIDRDSESGCSGTDSGRGPSEEGECGHHGDGVHHGHDQCGHGNCCCSSGIYAKKFHPHLHPNMYNSGHILPAQRSYHYCGPAHAHSQNNCSHGHECVGNNCNHGPKVTSPHGYNTDECTPLEALPPFGRHHLRDRMYPKVSRFHSDCAGARSTRQRLSLDPEEMAKHRQYGYAPSLPSLIDRHTPSPTFTSASDSQFYPYTGAHQQHNRLYPGANKQGTAFVPIAMKRTPSREDARSMNVSDDGTTTSGSYSMENIRESEPPKVVRLGASSEDCYV